jgi:hypothetical protein
MRVSAFSLHHCVKSSSYEANDKKKRASNKAESVRTVHLYSTPVLYTVSCNESTRSTAFFIDGTIDTLSNYHMHQLYTLSVYDMTDPLILLPQSLTALSYAAYCTRVSTQHLR